MALCQSSVIKKKDDCKIGTYRCSGDSENIEVCGHLGWVSLGCPPGTACTQELSAFPVCANASELLVTEALLNNTCVEYCKDLQTRVHCTDNQQIEDKCEENATCVVLNGKTTCKSAPTTPDSKECSSHGKYICKDQTTISVCNFNSWVDFRCPTQTYCTETLANYPVCASKSSINGQEFQADCQDMQMKCDGRTAFVCDSGSWYNTTCPVGSTCEVANGMAKCVSKSGSCPVDIIYT